MNPLQTATIAHFEAQRTRALANLQVYLTNPVGIGEHRDLVEEVVALIESIAHAEDCLEVLNRVVGTPEESPAE